MARGGFQEPNGAGTERVEQQLASFAFLREDREREVRLLFRDVPAGELALSFRRSGAALITVLGERASIPAGVPPVESGSATAAEEPGTGRSRRRRKPAQEAEPASLHAGEVTVRYFYSLGDVVYTVSIATFTGVAQSIAGIYPNAALPEREVSTRIGVIFTNFDFRTPQ